jgi:glutaredoxin
MDRCSLLQRQEIALLAGLRGLGAGLLLALLAWWPAAAALAAAPPEGAAGAVAMEVFVYEGCPHCAKAKVFLAELGRERPALRLTIRDVYQDPGAGDRLREILAAHPGVAASVPAFYLDGRLLIGFSGPETTGATLREMVDQAAARRTAPAGTPQTQGGYVDLPWIGKRLDIDQVGLPLFTIAIGLLDGFNPCSMWVLVLMVSMLAAVGDRRRMIAIAGTFVAVQGIAYFAFLAAWLNLFLVIGISRTSEIVLGVIALVAGLIHVKDYFAFGRGITLSIPAAAKPGIYQRMRALMHERSLALAIAGTVVLGILVQIVELLCTSGLPALYTRILTLRQLDALHYYGYIGLYIAMYMIDDVVLLGTGVVTLSQKRLQEKEGRLLKLVSGAIMVLLGIYLILMPH